jgi:ligand-binding sensor domain-containing protein
MLKLLYCMLMKKVAKSIILLIILLATTTQATKYNSGDWVNYSVFRYITSIAADQSVVYFGTTGGIIRYDRASQRWLDPLTVSDGLPSSYILKLAYDESLNELWAATKNGSAKYNLTFQEWYLDSEFPAQLVRNDWNAGSFPSMFVPFSYNYQAGVIQDQYFREYQITVGYRDPMNDNMYVGTWGLGPAIVDTRHIQLQLLRYGPFDYNISKVIELGDKFWMGTDYSRPNQALTSFDRQANEWNYYEPGIITDMADAELTCGVADNKFTWLGTRDGLLRLEGENHFKTFTTFNGLPSLNILSLAEFGGYLYVGTDDGLGVIPAKADVPDSAYKSPLPEEFLFRKHHVNALAVFKGKLYIATDRGVYRFDSDSLKVQSLDTPTGDLAAGARDIYRDGNMIYFAINYGIVAIDIVTDKSSLVTDLSLADTWNIYQIYVNNQYVWAATSMGLWRYKKEDKTTRLYTVADGLPTDYINSIIGDGDYLWLGTNQGLVRFLWNSPGRGD